MVRFTSLLRSELWAASAVASGWLVLLACTPVQAGPKPEAFPPAETFRKLQLVTFACSRENTASSCDQARASANLLLDHPRLPTSCKDLLWSIERHAQTAASNNLSRRDGLDRSASDLTVFCKPKPKSVTKPDGKSEPPTGAGSLGFGSAQSAR